MLIINEWKVVMMKYYKYLFMTESVEKKKDTIIRRLEERKLQSGIHILVLPESAKNQLEIYSSTMLLQPAFSNKDFFVVGIVKGYDAALELVEQILSDVYRETGGADIRSYILSKEQEE